MSDADTRSQILIAMLHLPRMGRRTLLKNCLPPAGAPCTAEQIRAALERGNRNKYYTDDDIAEAIRKSEEILRNCDKIGCRVVSFFDALYPRRLKLTADPAAVLYYRGNIRCLNEMPSVAIIGTREPSPYGLLVARNLGQVMAERGYIDVSGLAVGCDTAGHIGCLDGKGITAAALPCSLDTIYPKSNLELADQILANGGCLLSEYPPYSSLLKNAFIERDRLQSGLSDGVMVIETGIQGGTLHAVRYAKEYGRPVACFLHPDKYRTLEKAQGNQMLIRRGDAVPIAGNDDLDRFIEIMKTGKDSVPEEESPSGRVEQIDLFTYLENRKEKAYTKLVIFDLDMTILDTSSAENARKRRGWQAAYSCIPGMTAYAGIPNLIRMLQKSGCSVAVVTSSPGPYLEKILAHLGIDDVIKVSYHDTKRHKPAPNPLMHAASLAGGDLAPSDILAVGDSETDVVAARNAGYTSVHSCWDDPGKDAADQADYCCRSVPEFETLLRSKGFIS